MEILDASFFLPLRKWPPGRSWVGPTTEFSTWPNRCLFSWRCPSSSIISVQASFRGFRELGWMQGRRGLVLTGREWNQMPGKTAGRLKQDLEAVRWSCPSSRGLAREVETKRCHGLAECNCSDKLHPGLPQHPPVLQAQGSWARASVSPSYHNLPSSCRLVGPMDVWSLRRNSRKRTVTPALLTAGGTSMPSSHPATMGTCPLLWVLLPAWGSGVGRSPELSWQPLLARKKD